MSEKPLVTVVTIFLNTEPFLGEAVESVLAQSYDQWELLLVDDGSTDGSTSVARQYAIAHPGKVRYLDHEGHQNRGMSASRNVGLAHAAGLYVTFLDADDVWFPCALEERVAILTAHPEAAMVYGNREYWRSWTGQSEDAQRDTLSDPGIQPNRLFMPPLLLNLTYGSGGVTNPGSDVMVRREAALRVSGFEEAFRGLFEDQVFLIKIFLHEAVFVSDHCWLRYRQRPDSCVTVTTASDQIVPLWKQYLTWFETYLVQNAMQGTPAWQVVQRQLRPYRHAILFRVGRRVKQVARVIVPAPFRNWFRTMRRGRQ